MPASGHAGGQRADDSMPLPPPRRKYLAKLVATLKMLPVNRLAAKIKRLFPQPARPIQPADETDPAILRARALLDAKKWTEAFQLLNEVKSRKAAPRSVDYLRAFCFLQRQEQGAAVEALKEELRFHPDHRPAATLLADLANAQETRLGDAEFRQLFGRIRPYTMIGERRLFSLYTLACEVCQRDLPGNFAECGVAAGGSSALLAAVIARHSRSPRLLYAFDTFDGMPDTSLYDTHAGVPAAAIGWGAGTCAAPEDSLREVCAKLGVRDFVRPVKGLFADTLPTTRAQIGTIALLHVDGDWYASTRDILENLFDQTAPSAPIQIDDYGYWQGCQRAVREFEQKRSLHFQLQPIDDTGVWMSK